jgi:hypothetical protein
VNIPLFSQCWAILEETHDIGCEKVNQGLELNGIWNIGRKTIV